MSNPPDNTHSGPSNPEYITRQELLTRRARMLRQLANIYKDEYWALMEEIKDKYAEFCWEHGKATIDDIDEDVEIVKNAERENVAGADDVVERKAGKAVVVPEFGKRCAAYGCERKAMELTPYCFNHILLDERQVLYKGCKYVLRSSPVGPIFCNKPILSATVPSLCTAHKQRTEKHVAKALKKGGLSSYSASKSAPQFQVIVAEFVNQIQAKRRVAREVKKDPCEVNEEDGTFDLVDFTNYEDMKYAVSKFDRCTPRSRRSWSWIRSFRRDRSKSLDRYVSRSPIQSISASPVKSTRAASPVKSSRSRSLSASPKQVRSGSARTSTGF